MPRDFKASTKVELVMPRAIATLAMRVFGGGFARAIAAKCVMSGVAGTTGPGKKSGLTP